ncbi:unnamed protein product, partial [Laminaria digitata]
MRLSDGTTPVRSRHDLLFLLHLRRHRRAPRRGSGVIVVDGPTLSTSPSISLLLPSKPLLPLVLVLLVLLSEKVSVASGESSICDRRFVLRQRDSSNGIEGAASEDSQPSSSEDKHERRYGALSRGRGFMGAAVVEDPAVVVFAGGIGSGGTVVDSNVDAFSLGA